MAVSRRQYASYWNAVLVEMFYCLLSIIGTYYLSINFRKILMVIMKDLLKHSGVRFPLHFNTLCLGFKEVKVPIAVFRSRPK